MGKDRRSVGGCWSLITFNGGCGSGKFGLPCSYGAFRETISARNKGNLELIIQSPFRNHALQSYILMSN